MNINHDINYELIKQRRKELGLTQLDVVKQVRLLAGGLGQSGYVKIENGKSKRSKYLPQVCQVLGLKLADVDPKIGEVDGDSEKIISQILQLPEKDQLVIARRVLEALSDQ